MDLLLPKAVAELNAAWNPPRVHPPNYSDDIEEGYDEYGNEECNGSEQCACTMCGHHTHAAAAWCQVTDCHQPSRVIVQAWNIGKHTVQAKDITPGAGDEWVQLDEMPSYGWAATVCSYGHAHQIIEHDRSWRAKPTDTPESTMRYSIESWSYKPDEVDLPDILWELRNSAESLQRDVQDLTDAGCDKARPVFDAQTRLAEAKRRVAAIAARLAVLETRPRQARRWSAGSPEPADVTRVVVDGVPYSRHWDRATGTIQWEGPVINDIKTWEQLLERGEVVEEFPRAELVLPERRLLGV